MIEMLVLLFVFAFVAIAIYGHVLLLKDFWRIAASEQRLEEHDPDKSAYHIPAE